MKISKLLFVLFILVVPVLGGAQTLDCSKDLKYYRPEPPYTFDSQSKSAVCSTGNVYEVVISLYEGHEYRLSFSASAAFNYNMKFKIIDMGTSNTVLDLPGKSESGEKGTQVLKSYYDPDEQKTIQPHFDFYPNSTLNLKIIIDIAEIKSTAAPGTFDNTEHVKGCVTLFILDKVVPVDDMDWEKK